MKRTSFFMLSLLSLVLFSEEPNMKVVQAQTTGNGEWCTARGDAQSRGVAGCVVAEKPRMKWKFSATDDGGFEATAVIDSHRVYLGSTGGTFYALNLSDGKIAWTFHTKLGYTTPAVVHNGRVFAADADGFFRALDALTGREIWKREVSGIISAAPNVYKDSVLFTSENGDLTRLNAATGKLIWTYTSSDQLRCGITILNGKAYLGGCDKSLQIIDLETGKLTCRVPVDAPTGSTVALYKNIAYLGTEGARVLALNTQVTPPTVKWSYENPMRKAPFRSCAAVSNSCVYIGGQDKILHALDINTGKEIWKYVTRKNVDSSPVLVGDRVFFTTLDGKLMALNALSGAVLWEDEPGGTITASPAVAQGKILVGNHEGELFCWE